MVKRQVEKLITGLKFMTPNQSNNEGDETKRSCHGLEFILLHKSLKYAAAKNLNKKWYVSERRSHFNLTGAVALDHVLYRLLQ